MTNVFLTSKNTTMLGFVLIFFLGKAFYDLAEKFQKSQWGYALLGVAVFYGTQLLLGVAIAIFMELNNPNYWNEFDRGSEIGLNLTGLFFSGLFTLLFYNYLRSRWESQPTVIKKNDILDDDFFDLKK